MQKYIYLHFWEMSDYKRQSNYYEKSNRYINDNFIHSVFLYLSLHQGLHTFASFFVSGIYLLNIIHSTMLNNQAVFHEMHILKPQLNSLYLT